MMRSARFAGFFYPATARAAIAEIEEILARLPIASLPRSPPPVAVLVPHAGWSYSGAVTLAVLASIKESVIPETVIVFGNDHRRMCTSPAVYPRGAWDGPFGPATIDGELADALIHGHDAFRAAPREHADEHSIEVQIPLVQHMFGRSVRIVPVQVPSRVDAATLGRAAHAAAASVRRSILLIGTTDLSHYGPNYGFEPKGRGKQAVHWVKSENDRRMLDRIERLAIDEIEDEAHRFRNACSPGALAMTLAYAAAGDSERGILVSYLTSHDVVPADSFVGYAGFVFPSDAKSPRT